MRTVGAGLLGFIAGLFAGFALEVLIAGVGRLVLDDPGRPVHLALLPVALAVTGGIAALVADRRARRRERRTRTR
jgi:predicted lysophospholipase L1 biosynthesis ABC-type transport system permease subunit